MKRVVTRGDLAGRARVAKNILKSTVHPAVQGCHGVARSSLDGAAGVVAVRVGRGGWRGRSRLGGRCGLAVRCGGPVRVRGSGRVGVDGRGVQVWGVRHRGLGQVPAARARSGPPIAVCRAFAALFRRRSKVVRTPATTSATRLAFTTSATFATVPATPARRDHRATARRPPGRFRGRAPPEPLEPQPGRSRPCSCTAPPTSATDTNRNPGNPTSPPACPDPVPLLHRQPTAHYPGSLPGASA